MGGFNAFNFLMTLISRGRAGLLASATAVMASVIPMDSVQAQYVYGDSYGYDQAMRRESRLTPQQQEEMFRARKSWKRRSFNRRISILETEKRCIDGARNASAFKSCLKQRKEARQALRSDYRAYINPVRQRVGLPPIEKRKGGRRDGGRRRSANS